jgi:hypothetical protein
MAQITKEQKTDYEKLCHLRNNGQLLTPDGIRFICEANGYDAEAIGKQFLELLMKVCPQK